MLSFLSGFHLLLHPFSLILTQLCRDRHLFLSLLSLSIPPSIKTLYLLPFSTVALLAYYCKLIFKKSTRYSLFLLSSSLKPTTILLGIFKFRSNRLFKFDFGENSELITPTRGFNRENCRGIVSRHEGFKIGAKLKLLAVMRKQFKRYDLPWTFTKYIPFCGGADYHDYHHYVRGQSQSNFASVFTYCDYIYGKDKFLSNCYQAEAPRPSGSLVLAGSRTKRPDILRKYVGGWDITNKLYCASVGFTGCAALILAIIWFVLFGVAMITHHFCGWRIDIKGKEFHLSQMLWLILLIVFTCVVAKFSCEFVPYFENCAYLFAVDCDSRMLINTDNGSLNAQVGTFSVELPHQLMLDKGCKVFQCLRR
ncbi:hypothetical protein L1887_26856 [Cichorium endivia]|nr:hypothetical protein L1887_26856 [Cichorium endivia]